MPNPFTIAIRSADKKMRQISRKFAKVALHIQLAHQMALTGLSVLGRIRPPFASTKRSQFPIQRSTEMRNIRLDWDYCRV